MSTTVTISEANNGMQVDIEMKGTEGVPVSLELVFRRGGQFKGVEAVEGKVDAYLLKGSWGSYTVGNDTIQFGPGKAEHKWLTVRGGLPAMDAPAVYITGYTPFKHSFRIS